MSLYEEKMQNTRGRRDKKPGFVYILTNKMRTVFYTGVTSQLKKRIEQHRNGEGSAFTKKYKVKYLVYFEEYPTIQQAIEREKQLKNWRRAWKLALIRKMNPTLRDLFYEL